MDLFERMEQVEDRFIEADDESPLPRFVLGLLLSVTLALILLW